MSLMSIKCVLNCKKRSFEVRQINLQGKYVAGQQKMPSLDFDGWD